MTEQHIVPLETFVKLRRKHEQKARCNWVRDASAGKIPGAFQFAGKGPWFVNLDTYDAEVQKLSAPRNPAPAAGDVSLQSIADMLGLSLADIQLAARAAGR